MNNFHNIEEKNAIINDNRVVIISYNLQSFLKITITSKTLIKHLNIYYKKDD